jgi:hypothetical protein
MTDGWGVATTIGTCAQALFLGVAFLAAWRQVHLYKKSERAKTTLEYLRDYDRLLASALREVFPNDEPVRNLDRIKSELAKPFEDADRLKLTRYVNDLYNYYDAAASLLQRGVLDSELFLSQLDELLLEAYVYILALGMHEKAYALSNLKPLVKKAHVHYLAAPEGSKEYLRGLLIT